MPIVCLLFCSGGDEQINKHRIPPRGPRRESQYVAMRNRKRTARERYAPPHDPIYDVPRCFLPGSIKNGSTATTPPHTSRNPCSESFVHVPAAIFALAELVLRLDQEAPPRLLLWCQAKLSGAGASLCQPDPCLPTMTLVLWETQGDRR